MLEQIIADYLKSNRRLIVPQLGSFIVKDGGGVVFSELLKRDDGILRNILMSEHGMTEVEAAGAIDRFVFEVRRSLQDDLVFELHGLGIMTCGHNGAIVFRYQSAADAARRHQTGNTTLGQDSDVYAPVVEPKISPSPKLNPEPYVKGLRYGKPHKSTHGYSYVGRTRSGGVDKFVVVAIIAAVLAVAAIVYGYISQSKDDQELPSDVQTEQTGAQPTTDGAANSQPSE